MILQLTAYTMTLWLVLTWLAVNRFTSATCTGAEWQTRNRIFMADWACSGSGRPNWINLLQAKISLYTIVLHTISNTEWTIQHTTVLDIYTYQILSEHLVFVVYFHSKYPNVRPHLQLIFLFCTSSRIYSSCSVPNACKNIQVHIP